MWKRLIVLVLAIVVPLIPVVLLIRQSSSGLSSYIEQADRLPSLTGDQVRALSGGEEVVIEGTIDPQTPITLQTFVAYEQQYSIVDNDLGRYWRTEQQVTPPLWVKLADGQLVRIVNTTYQLQHLRVDLPAGTNASGRPTRYAGLQIGDRVTVIGRWTVTTEGGALHAYLVAGGSRAAWLADERGISPTTLDAVVVAGLALSVVALAAWWLARHRPHPAAPAGV